MPELPPFPPAFTERLQRILPPARYAEAMAAMAAPRDTVFRVNRLLAHPEAVRDALEASGLPVRPLPPVPDAFAVPAHAREALMALPAYQSHALYIQNLSSMLPPLVLAPEPGEAVLDLAAAPGSKTLQLASALAHGDELAAVEVVKGRFMRLKRNLAEHGAAWVRTYLQDGTRVWRHRPEHFDRVLLDAPCSSEGRFHAEEPESYAYWSERKIREMERKQRQLLFSAVQCLKPGGTLVYATCSLAPEENEAVVDRVLRRFGDALALEPIDLELPAMTPPLPAWGRKTFHPALAAARRIVPTAVTEGFFICRIKKNRSTQ